jgi:dihydroorotate dehydrogenase (NAD+) catalytic subunit
LRRSPVDLTCRVGSLELANPVMTASGTSGHGRELAAYGDLAALGAVVVKSLAHFPWPGNPPPRVVPAAAGMLNSVGLPGPGLEAWAEDHLPGLQAEGCSVVVSVWGHDASDYAKAVGRLASLLEEYGLLDEHRPGAPGRHRGRVVAVEANLSCPNTADPRRMFAQDPSAAAEVVAACLEGLRGGGVLPLWAKLTAAVADVTEIAGSALQAGASALTLVNTMPALAVDLEERRPALGAGQGGLSGPALHPIALRCVRECRRAFPTVGIVGVGGVDSGRAAAAMLLAGADAVQVGTATFADPRAPWKVLDGLRRWCVRNRVERVADLVGQAALDRS